MVIKPEHLLRSSLPRSLLCKLGIHTDWSLLYTTFGTPGIKIPYERFCRYCGHIEDNPYIQTR